jgi:hypothetical protein
MVVVTVCLDSSQEPACRMSYSLLNISAPVGHTPMQAGLTLVGFLRGPSMNVYTGAHRLSA